MTVPVDGDGAAWTSLAVEKRASETGRTLLGFYHSHPNHPAVPSAFDLAHAWPNLRYLILSVRGGRPEEARTWKLREDRSAFDEEIVFAVAALRRASRYAASWVSASLCLPLSACEFVRLPPGTVPAGGADWGEQAPASAMSRWGTGSRQMIRVPRPGAESIATVPPCSSIRLLTSDRPRPAPDCRAPRSNLSNTRA